MARVTERLQVVETESKIRSLAPRQDVVNINRCLGPLLFLVHVEWVGAERFLLQLEISQPAPPCARIEGAGICRLTMQSDRCATDPLNVIDVSPCCLRHAMPSLACGTCQNGAG